ncbi:MAG: hypothetical protein HY317_06240 [Acidobacteria bacterium]|nr:hypothetical protein [Acidobacteriota bacterium]
MTTCIQRKGRRCAWRARRAAAWSAAAVLGLAVTARAQSPVPTPRPERLDQDALDLQTRASVVLGSGARAFGMGGAFLARADDATAASWNPAGLSYLRRPELSAAWVGLNRLDRTTRVPPTEQRPDGEVVTDRTTGNAPDFLAFTYPFEAGRIDGAAQISFQRAISFTGTRTIERERNVRTVEASGGFDVLALGSGLQVSREVRVGATINKWFNGYSQIVERELRRRTRQDTDFDLSGWNLHLGVIWTPVESLNLAAVAKTPFSGDVRLSRTRVDRESRQGAPDRITTNAFASDDVELRLPGAAGVGASWRPWSPVTVSLDYTRTFWSGGRIHDYFTLPPANDDGSPVVPQAPEDVFERLPYPDLVASDQQDTEQTRIGAEYVLILGRIKVPLRAGFFTDRQYFRELNEEPPLVTIPVEGGDPVTLPVRANRPPRFSGWTAGTGILVGPILFDVAYLREYGDYTDLNGDRVSFRAHRVFVSAIYRHAR